MSILLTLLQQYTHDIVTRDRIVTQNWTAVSADADAIAQAQDERKSHREFSIFTPRDGRA